MADNALMRLQAAVIAELLEDADPLAADIERAVARVCESAPVRALVQQVASLEASLARQIADFEAFAAHVCPVIEEAQDGE